MSTISITFEAPPVNSVMHDKNGNLTAEWANWFTQLELLLNEQIQQINAALP